MKIEAPFHSAGFWLFWFAPFEPLPHGNLSLLTWAEVPLFKLGSGAMERDMPYFNKTDHKFTRVGKVVGDLIAASIYLSIIALALSITMRVI